MEQIKISDLSLWEAFYWVCQKQTFTAAAKQLKISVPFLSKKIGRLEEELGVRLFNRTTRRVSRTPEALALLPRVKSWLEEAAEMESGARRQEAKGLIRLSSFPAFAHRVLAPLLVRFQKEHPLVSFELLVADAVVDLIDSQVDVAIRVQAPTGAQFVFRKLMENRLLLCAAPAYLRENKSPLHKIEDLRGHRLLALSVYQNCRFTGSAHRVSDFRGNQNLFCESGSALTSFALAGAGVAVRSEWDVRPYLDSGELVQVLRKFPIESFGEIYAVTPHRKFPSYRVRLFLDYLVSAIKEPITAS